MEPTQVSTQRRTDKENVVCVHNGIFFPTIKNDTFLSFAEQWMPLEITVLSEESMFSVICGPEGLYSHINSRVCIGHESRNETV